MIYLRGWGPQVSTGRGSECVEVVRGAWARPEHQGTPCPTPFSTSPPPSSTPALTQQVTHGLGATVSSFACNPFLITHRRYYTEKDRERSVSDVRFVQKWREYTRRRESHKVSRITTFCRQQIRAM